MLRVLTLCSCLQQSLLHHHRKPLHCILPLTKTRVSLPSYSQRVHLHVVRKRHVTTTERYFSSQAKDHLGSAVPCLFFLPSSVALSISCSFVCPLLATTACVLVAKEEKQPFKGLGLSLLAMNMLHSLLSSTRFLRYCYSTPLSTGIIKNKTAFSRLPLPLLPLPLSSSSVKIPGSEAQEIHLLCCSGGWGRGVGRRPCLLGLACGSRPCAKERSPV